MEITPPRQDPTRLRRHRLLFLAALCLVLAIGAGASWMVRQALTIRATGSSEFSAYVTQEHIGQVEITSDASGFEADFCVLLVRQRPADSALASDVLTWLKMYHALDGGTMLSVHWRDPSTGRELTLADATYDPSSNTVTLDLHQGGSIVQRQVHVDWTGISSGTQGDAS
ncbi:MAG: hypothetical protein IRZ10_00960 [Thermoflavifilum sp.]|nr:hypothetical protein [Thermoflavifilum sp.]MCL6512957.1 hypothetical protein [Alicyclobacillus sp.]